MGIAKWLLRSALATSIVLTAGAVSTFSEESKPKEPERKTYVSKEFDFTLDVTEFSQLQGIKQVTALQAVSPQAVGGFSPNVNVIIQMQSTTPTAYLETTKRELESMKWEVVESKEITHAGKPALWVEYTGKAGSREMHWYALAICLEDRVILVTGSAAEKDFEKISEKLKAAVQSVNLVS